MRVLTGLARAARPQQWVKNLFVFAPLFFKRKWDASDLTLRVVAAFAIFCLASSAIYLLNDTLDREADRSHPRKKHRPIASGQVPPQAAVFASLVLMIAAVASAHFGLADARVTGVIATYLGIHVAYSLRLKHVVLLDVLCIASGFVLRLLAGGFAGDVQQSQWILICTIFLSLLLALCKRRSEVVSLGDDASDHRSILSEYPTELLDQLIAAATAAVLVTYALYTVDPRTATLHGSFQDAAIPAMVATVPGVVYGVFRYLFLVHRRGGGGSPTSTLVRDLPSLVNVAIYGLTVWAVFRFGSTG